MWPLRVEFESFPALLLRQPYQVENIDCLAPIPHSAVRDTIQADLHRWPPRPSKPFTAPRLYSFAAASSVAMSNFTIFIIAAMALGWFTSSPIFSGTICQHKPNLSVSQLHAIGLPPSSSLSQ